MDSPTVCCRACFSGTFRSSLPAEQTKIYVCCSARCVHNGFYHQRVLLSRLRDWRDDKQDRIETVSRPQEIATNKKICLSGM